MDVTYLLIQQNVHRKLAMQKGSVQLELFKNKTHRVNLKLSLL